MVDVEPARRDVGGDEDFDRPFAELPHHAVALILRQAAVDRFGAIPATVEGVGDTVRIGARAAEDERRRRRFEIEDAGQRRGFVVALDDVDDLADLRGFPGGELGFLHFDPHRFVLVLRGHLGDARRHRRREEGRLALLRRFGEDRVEVFGEAHVEHFVGFVEYDRLDVAEVHRAAADVVECATRRGDDDVGLGADGARLFCEAGAAVHGDDFDFQGRAVLGDGIGHLDGEFARRHQYEGRGALAIGVQIQFVDDRQCEGRGFAGARGGETDEVFAFQQHGDTVALNGGRFGISVGGEGFDELDVEAEIRECFTVGRLRRSRGRVRVGQETYLPPGGNPGTIEEDSRPGKVPQKCGSNPDASSRTSSIGGRSSLGMANRGAGR